MPAGWRTTTFDALIRSGALEISDGYRAKNAELGGTGPIFLRAGHVREEGIEFDGAERFRDELTSRVLGKLSRPGDTIVTTKGNSTGRTAYVTATMPPFVYSPHLSYWRPIDPHVLLPGFLRYWARSREFQVQLGGMKASTDMAPYLSLVDQRRLRITLPPAPKQEAIGRILESLDEKIHLNRRMNKTLEGIARALFKSWFVDFDPVRAKADGRETLGLGAVAAGSVPDSFEDSSVGKIPQGWQVSTIGRVVEFAYGKALKEEMRVRGPIPVYGSNGRVGWHSEPLVKGPGVIVGRKGNPGIVTWVPSDFFPIDTTFYIVPKGPIASMVYLFHALSHQDLPSLGADSAVPGLNRNIAYMTLLLVPPRDLVAAFDRHVSGFFARISANEHESESLAALRDTLLPKLLSGEIRVPDAERQVEQAV